MSDVFLSYSRKDKEFAQRLNDRLRRIGKSAWIDWEDIPLSAPDWWFEIQVGIRAAHSFLYIASPDSMASVVCNIEFDYVIEMG